MVYVPSKPPAVSSADGQALAAYLDDEMKSVAAGLRTSDSILFSVSNKAPVKPRQGQLVYSDGTNWNPGSGEGLYVYSAAGTWVWLEDNPVIPTIPPLPRGHIFGLTMSTTGSSSTLSVAAGLACDSTGVSMISLASTMSKTTAIWAAGTAAGGLDAGTIQASKWYAWYVIENPTSGAIDVIYSLNTTAPAFPSGYTLYRRIGFGLTNASSQWVLFHQLGDEFLWDALVTDVNAIATTNSSVSKTLTVPTGVQVYALFSARSDYGTGASATYFTSLDQAAPTSGGAVAMLVYPTSGAQAGQFKIRTNTLAQIRVTGNGTGATYSIVTNGWIDDRGRNA